MIGKEHSRCLGEGSKPVISLGNQEEWLGLGPVIIVALWQVTSCKKLQELHVAST